VVANSEQRREGKNKESLQQSTILTRKTNSSMFGCGNVSDPLSDTLKVGEGFMGDVIKLEKLACSDRNK
jgi:hypothetical protein